MAYLSEYGKLTFGGSTAGGEEIFSCGITILLGANENTARDNYLELGEQIDAFGALIEAFYADPDVRTPIDSKMLWCKWALIGTDGKYVEEPISIPLDGEGGVTGSYVPQNAVVNTLASSKWKDPGKYNRFYLPFAFGSGDNAWHLPTGVQAAYADRLKEFVDQLNALCILQLPSELARVGVASPAGPGYEEYVSEVKVGRIIDTQRRRRNQLSEDYVSRSIDITP